MEYLKKIAVFLGIFCLLGSSMLLSRGTLEMVEKWAAFVQNSDNNSELSKIFDSINTHLLDQHGDSSSESVNCHTDFDLDVDLFIPVTELRISPPRLNTFVQIMQCFPKVKLIYLEVKLLPPAFC